MPALRTETRIRKFPFTSNGMEECIRKGAEAIGWKQKWQKPNSAPGPIKKGLGMAVHACRHGAMTLPSSGMVKINADGTVNVLTGTSDLGGGQKGTMAMIAAEELGSPPGPGLGYGCGHGGDHGYRRFNR